MQQGSKLATELVDFKMNLSWWASNNIRCYNRPLFMQAFIAEAENEVSTTCIRTIYTALADSWNRN